MIDLYVVEVPDGTFGREDFICLYIGSEAAEKAATTWNALHASTDAKARKVSILSATDAAVPS